MRLHLRRSLPALLPLAMGALASGAVVVAMVVTVLPAFFVASDAGSDSLGIGAWRALGALPDIGTSVALTLVTGAGATLLSFVLACCVCAWAMTPGRIRPTLVIAAAVAAVPPAALAAEVDSLSWPAGAWWGGSALGSHASVGLLMVVLSLKEAPFLAAMMLIALPRVAVEGHVALATTLGYSRAEAFAKVALPQIIPRMRLPVWAALAWSLSAVSVASILGPEAPPTLAMVAWRGLATGTAGQHGVGAAAAGVVLALAVAAIALFRALERVAVDAGRAWLCRGGRGRVADAVAGAGMAITAAGLVVFVAALAGLLRSWAGAPMRADAGSPSQALVSAIAGPSGAAAGSPDAALATTLIIGAVATLIALAMAIACLEAEDRARLRGGWPILLWVPWVVPQIAFVPGMAWILSNAGSGAPMSGMIAMAGMIVAQLVFVFSCVALVLIGPWRTLDPRYAQSAAALRAAPRRVLARVKLPLLAQPIGMACAIGMAASIALYLPTHVIEPGAVTTLVNAVVSNSHAITSRATALDATMLALLPIALVAVALRGRQRPVPGPVAWQPTGA